MTHRFAKSSGGAATGVLHSAIHHRAARLRCFVVVLASACCVQADAVHLVDEAPVSIRRVDAETLLVDFGRVSFGNLRLLAPGDGETTVTIHFGEDFVDGRVNREPPGTVRYASAEVRITGDAAVIAAPAPDARNTKIDHPTTPPAVLTPPEWGVILPFRWVEIEGWPGELAPEQITRRSAFSKAWDDDAADFESSDELLNRIWELCRYSIKATTFASVYVDGDRERIPYEADAYLNQLSHYATDNDVQMARDTFDWLMKHPTWPTEWAFHMIFVAYADHLHTGETEWLAARYESLKPKLLLERAREDGLLVSNEQQVRRDDIVDWPRSERDGFVFRPVNTVVNAFHIRSLQMMATLAEALGKDDEAAKYAAMAERALEAFQKHFFNTDTGNYRDGVGTDHASQHANLFPLALGLVPEAAVPSVVAHIVSRGMACSVYAAQYLLEGLFENGAGDHAMALITAPNDRSWRHMVESGTTITWEAWDMKYKPNQDWNHAWGAAPANLLPRYVLGIEAAAPGWVEARVRPHPGTLAFAKGKVPTPRGPVVVEWKNDGAFEIDLTLPEGTVARLELPAAQGSTGLAIDGEPVAATRVGDRWVADEPVAGSLRAAVRMP